MGDYSAIEWTDSTWNPATGCSLVSPGCRFCYAKTLSEQLRDRGMRKYANGFDFTLQPQELELPVHWKKPRKIFVNSMSDLFHEQMSLDYLERVFDVMRRADWHVYQILTKRPDRMLAYAPPQTSNRDSLSFHCKLGTTEKCDRLWCKS